MNKSENYPYFMVRTATGLALTFANKEISYVWSTDSWVWPCLSRHLCFWHCCTSPTQFDAQGAKLVSTRPTCYVSFQYSIYSNTDVADAQPAHAT